MAADPNEDVHGMLRRLERTGVTVAVPAVVAQQAREQPDVSYTPRGPITVRYCGVRESEPEQFKDAPDVISTKTVQFKSRTDKKDSVLEMFPEIVMTENKDLVFYEKSGNKYKKVTKLNSFLKKMVNRSGHENCVVYAFVIDRERFYDGNENQPPRAVQDNNDTLGDMQTLDDRDRNAQTPQDPPSPRVERSLTEPQRALRTVNNPARASQFQRDERLLSSDEEERNIENREVFRRIQNLESVSTGSRNQEMFADEERMFTQASENTYQDSNFSMSPTPNLSSRFITNVPSGAGDRLVHDDSRGSFPFRSGYMSPSRIVDELPEISAVQWREVRDLPTCEEVGIDTVLDPDCSSLKASIQEIKKEPDQRHMLPSDPIKTLPEKLSSEWSTSQMNDKLISMKSEVEEVKNGDLTEQLFTLLCLKSVDEVDQASHVVTPDDIKCIKRSAEPYKPQNINDVTKIIILETDQNLAFVSVLQRDEFRNFCVKNIVTEDDTKFYLCKLMIEKIGRILNITVNFFNSDNEVFKPLNSQDNSPMSIFFPMLLTVRKLLGFDPQFSLNALDCYVDSILKSLNDLESASQGTDSEPDSDWYSTEQDNKRLKMENERLRTGLRSLQTDIVQGEMSE